MCRFSTPLNSIWDFYFNVEIPTRLFITSGFVRSNNGKTVVFKRKEFKLTSEAVSYLLLCFSKLPLRVWQDAAFINLCTRNVRLISRSKYFVSAQISETCPLRLKVIVLNHTSSIKINQSWPCAGLMWKIKMHCLGLSTPPHSNNLMLTIWSHSWFVLYMSLSFKLIIIFWYVFNVIIPHF